MTVSGLAPTRKQLFDAGLALQGKMLRVFCEEQHISRHHLLLVLHGEREGSARLNAAIDAVIARVSRAADHLESAK